MCPRLTVRIMAVLILCVVCGPQSDQARAQSTKSASSTPDQLLAPIALYPDSLLAQILMSAANSETVADLDAWLKKNQNLKGTKLQDAAVKAGFEASYVALVLFPEVVTYMAENILWTRSLGALFATDRDAVFASVQRLRQQAKTVGTLTSNAQQKVETKTTSAGEEVIVIEPTNPQVVYVPQYNTEVVYTQAPTTTVVIQEDDDDAEEAVAAGLIGFTAGIAIGAAVSNPYYYGPYGWHGGGYMYADAWDDYYDAREDARDDWMDHREDLVEERGDRLEDRNENISDRRENTQEQRTDRQQNRQENRPESQAERTERAQQARSDAAQRETSSTQRTQRTGSPEARGYNGGARAEGATQRSGRSDAFAGYSSGASQRASSSRGQRSRGASRGGGGRRR